MKKSCESIWDIISILIDKLRSIRYRGWRERLINGNDICYANEDNDYSYRIGSVERVSITGDHYECVGGNVNWLKIFTGDFDLKAPVYTLHNKAYLIGVNAVVVSRHNNILLESTLNSKGYLNKTGDAKYLMNVSKFETQENYDIAISLVNILSRSYFHWLIEVMPLLQSYFEYVKRHDVSPKIIINSNPANYQLEYLKLIGISTENIIIWDCKKAIVKTLIVPSLRFERLQVDEFWAWHLYSKKALNWVSSSLTFPRNDNPRYDKIYLSRKDSRIVVNDQYFQRRIEEYGFKTVYLEDYCVLDQIQLFREVKIIISVHGAALANLIFGEGIRVIELFPDARDSFLTYHFFQISSYFNHHHTLFFCETVNENHDIVVDCEKVCDILEGYG